MSSRPVQKAEGEVSGRPNPPKTGLIPPTVQVTLRDASFDPQSTSSTSFKSRVITLDQSNDWVVKIGRATSSDPTLGEAVDNARFSSKVVSREHAIFSASLGDKTVSVMDLGSMHGTHIRGRRLEADKPYILHDGDTVQFGTAVDRGAETFRPVEVRFSNRWIDHMRNNPLPNLNVPNLAGMPSSSIPLTYPAPPYVEDHNDYNFSDEAESISDDDPAFDGFVQNPDPPRRYSVPESGDSEEEDDLSIYSDDEDHEEAESESPSSSPHSVEEPAMKTTTTTTIDVKRHFPVTMPETTIDIVDVEASGRVKICDLMDEAQKEDDSDVELVREDWRDDGFHDEHVDDSVEMYEPQPASLRVPSSSSGVRDPSPSDAAMARRVSTSVYSPITNEKSAPTNPTFENNFQVKHERIYEGSGHVWQPSPVIQPDAPPQPQVPEYHPWSYATEHQPELYQPQITAHYNPWTGVHLAQDPYVPALESRAWVAPESSRKRKAGKLDAEVPEVTSKEPRNRSAIEEEAVPIVAPDVSIAVPIASVEKEQEIAIVIPSIEEHTRKKQKTSHGKKTKEGSAGKTFAKYAAVSLVSLGVGAVGAVMGLAALPADFFV